MLLFGLSFCASAQSWQPLANQPLTFAAGPCFLMTDGSVLVQDAFTLTDWWKLTPDVNGNYVQGTWTQLPSLPATYAPFGFVSAVLKDGRFLALGAEGNIGTGGDDIGVIYDPVTNAWTNLAGPLGWTQAGDDNFAVLPDGKIFATNNPDTRAAIWDPVTLLWTPIGTGKVDQNDEEQVTLLPDGTLLTVDATAVQNAEKYIPWTGTWVNAGTLPAAAGFGSLGELGPTLLLYNGTVLNMGGTGHNAIYFPPATPTDPGTWVAAPDFPLDTSNVLMLAEDGGACLMPNGHVLCPIENQTLGGIQFVEYNGVGWVNEPNVPNGPFDFLESTSVLDLPSGQVLFTDGSQDVEIYTPSGSPLTAWKPTITNAPAHVFPTVDSTIQGTQFNGLSQAEAHGDDMDNATNYPLVRITNNATGHVSYARTHDHSTMAVATGTATVSTVFTPSITTEQGPSTLQVIANGIASAPVAVSVDPKTVRSIGLSAQTVPSGTSVTGTVTLVLPAPAGGTTVNLSSNNAAIVVPATVIVLPGQTTVNFNATTVNSTYVPTSGTVTASYLAEPTNSVALTVNPGNYAQFVSQTTPTSMGASEHYTVTLQFKNTGTTTWDTAHSYKVRSLSPANNSVWGFNRIALSNSPVATGGTGNFTVTLLSPTVPGTYNFAWQMIQDNLGIAFGPGSPNVAVVVAKVADEAQYVSQTVPITIAAGTDFKPTIVFKNVGTATWSSAGGYFLKSRNPYNNVNWGTSTAALPASIAPGSSATFLPTFTSPATPGTYGFQWSMMHNGTLFGDLSVNVQVVVTLGAHDALFVSTTGVPLNVGIGSTVNAVVTFQNLGTATWDSTYSMVSRNPYLNTNWGVSAVAVTGTVAQNANAVFTHAFTAPSVPGTYHFKWRMSVGGVPFGQESSDLAVVVTGTDAAHYVSKTGALSVNAGQDFYVQYTMQNIGSGTWSSATNYNLRSIDPVDNLTWGKNRGYLPGTTTVAPQASVTITVLCTAPLIAGTYPMQWQMNHISTLFGDTTPLLSMTVTLGPDDASYVSETGIPTSFPHSTAFGCFFVMKNLGTATWSSAYTLVPITTPNFGVASITAPTTAPGASGTFGATFTTPATAGTYHIQFRMMHNGVLFGQATQSVTITVT